MGCCESREVAKKDQQEHLANEVWRSKSQLKTLEKDLQMLQDRLLSLRTQLDDFSIAVQERMELSRITTVLAKLEEATQAQFVSERHSTHLTDEELLENIKCQKIRKVQDQLREWSDQTKSHLEAHLDVSTLQEAQAKLQELTTEVRNAYDRIKKCHKVLIDKIGSMQLVDVTSWKVFEEKLANLCESLISASDNTHKSFSSLIVKLQESISERDLEQKLTEVQQSLTLLQSEVKPIDRKSYKEITEEVVFFDPITRTSTADSISHFEQLFVKSSHAPGPGMNKEELEQVATALLRLIDERFKVYVEKLEAFRPLELDILEHFLTNYKTKAADKLRQFAKALEELETEDYALFVARALCFSPERHFHFLPKLLNGLKPHCRDFNWKTGGLLHIRDLIPLLENWFRKEPGIGEIITNEIAAATVGTVPFFTFYVQEKMQMTKTSPEELFKEMDEEDLQHLRVELFAKRLKKRFEVLLAQDEDLTAVGAAMDVTSSDAIFRTQFIPTFSTRLDLPDVNCSQIVKAFESAYSEIQADQAYELYQLFSEESGPDYRLSLPQVVPLLQRMRPTLSTDHIQHLCSKAKLQQSGHLTFEEFREVVWKYNLKSPVDSYFGQELYDIDHVEVSEEVMDLVSSLS